MSWYFGFFALSGSYRFSHNVILYVPGPFCVGFQRRFWWNKSFASLRWEQLLTKTPGMEVFEERGWTDHVEQRSMHSVVL